MLTSFPSSFYGFLSSVSSRFHSYSVVLFFFFYISSGINQACSCVAWLHYNVMKFTLRFCQENGFAWKKLFFSCAPLSKTGLTQRAVEKLIQDKEIKKQSFTPLPTPFLSDLFCQNVGLIKVEVLDVVSPSLDLCHSVSSQRTACCFIMCLFCPSNEPFCSS